jgi:predicted MFS family arabinose efflux permease
LRWAILLAAVPALIALSLGRTVDPAAVLIIGLLVFGVVFAINSAMHSYLIVSYARDDGVSLDVGFYYMANAMGRLLGTLLSGWVFQSAGLAACLWISCAMIVLAALISIKLPFRAQGLSS